jgi:AraC-like DNA-binding protein
MNPTIQSIGTSLLAAGALHGAYLTAIALTKQNPEHPSRTMANRFLGIYFGAFTFFLVNGALFFAGWLQKAPFLLGVPMPFLYLIGPGLWFYINFMLRPDREKLRPVEYWHFAPAILIFLLASPYYFSDPAAKAAYLAQLTPGKVELPANRAFYFGGHLLQTAAYLFVLRPKVRRAASVLRSTPVLQWLRRLFLLLTALLAIYFATFVTFIFFENIRAEARFGFEVVLALFIHFNFWLILRESAILKGETAATASENNGGISPRQAALLKTRILNLMEVEKPYLEPDFTLSDLTDRLNSNTYYVSQTINQELGQTFPEFINTFRVETARRLLRESDMKILAVALESGFNNKNTFNRVFKKLTGMTPSAYRKRQCRP